jgi:hypothetical protein
MRHYPHWIKAFLHHTRHAESPTNFHYWTAVSTIAGALQRKVWINQLHFQWIPNFYIVFVAPPGVAAKSTTIANGMSILKQVPKVKFGPPSLTWQALAVALAEAQEVVTYPNGDKRTMCALTIPVSELGTFLKPDDEMMQSIMIDLWDGKEGEWSHATKTTGTTKILNPWLNIIGCTTPTWLKNNFNESVTGGGLSSRIIFVFGDKKRHLIAYPSRNIDTSEYTNEHARLVEDLKQIAQIRGEYKMTEEAMEFGSRWYETLWGPRKDETSQERFDDHFARKQTQAHKLAMVISAAKKDELIIEREDLEEAIVMITSLEADLLKMFSSLATNPLVRHTQEIVKIVKNHGEIEYATLRRIVFNTIPQRDLETSIQEAVKANLLITRKVNNKFMIIFNDGLTPTPAHPRPSTQGKAS